MKNRIHTICYTFILLMVCVFTILFLSQYTKRADYTAIPLEWEAVTVQDRQGVTTSIPPKSLNEITSFQNGDTYVFKTTLAGAPGGSYLRLETSGAEISISVNGEELYQSDILLPDGSIGMSFADIPIHSDWEQSVITMSWSPVASDNYMLPYLRIVSNDLTEISAMAYANLSALPAGMFGFIFVMICGIFLIGLQFSIVDYSLIPLAASAMFLMINKITLSMGYYFLPEKLLQVLCFKGFTFVPAAGIIIYLLMNRKRSFWRYLLYLSLFLLVLLGTAYGFSLLTHTYLAKLVRIAVSDLFLYRDYSLIQYWITAWLVLVGACISSYGLFRQITIMRSENQLMLLKNQKLMDDYRTMESRQKQTAALRHEITHHLSVMKAMCDSKETAQINSYLEKLTEQPEYGLSECFTPNAILNSILQNAASRAKESNILFGADIDVPEYLAMDKPDLCSLIMNMLDNALEACQRMAPDDKPFIDFQAHLKHGFLAIRCENSYFGTLAESSPGCFETLKSQPSLHGFGLKQMAQIAEKYSSILDVSHKDGTFIVQTALKL